MEKTIIPLRIPTLATPTKNSFDTRPKKVKEWIESLPRANVGEITRSIYNALRIVNHLDIPATDRIKFLEQINEPITYILKSFDKHFLAMAFPLPEKRRNIIRLAFELQDEMIMGYKIPIAQKISSKKRLDKKSTILSIHRSLFYLDNILEKYYQVYASPPRHTWYTIHQLYQHAYSNKYHDAKLEEPNGKDEKYSIDDIYKRILMLSLAKPYCLRQGEVGKTLQALKSRWVSNVQLISDMKDAPKSGLFITDTNSDTAPIFQTVYQGNHTQTCLGLNIKPLLKELRSEVHQSSDTTLKQRLSKENIDQDLLSRLLDAWQTAPKRMFQRLKNNTILDITIGLSCTHHFMTKNQPEEPEEAPVDTKNEAPSLSDVIYGSDDNIFVSQAFPAAENTNAPGISDRVTQINTGPLWQRTATQTGAGEDNANYVMQQWTMVNLSAGGYCLMWDKGLESQAQVGELIGLHEQKNDLNHWNAGVIRWLRCRPDCGIEVGLHILSPSAIPIQLKQQSSKVEKYSSGLLLPIIDAIDQPQSLILPTMPFQVNDEIEIIINGQVNQARLTRLLENTSNFHHFLFRYTVESFSKKMNDKPLDQDKNNSYENIWSDL